MLTLSSLLPLLFTLSLLWAFLYLLLYLYPKPYLHLTFPSLRITLPLPTTSPLTNHKAWKLWFTMGMFYGIIAQCASIATLLAAAIKWTSNIYAGKGFILHSAPEDDAPTMLAEWLVPMVNISIENALPRSPQRSIPRTAYINFYSISSL